MQSPQEKLFYLAKVLNDKFVIAPIDEAIIFKFECLQDISNIDCYYMLKKFAEDFHVIDIIEEQKDFARIKKNENFNDAFLLGRGKAFKSLYAPKQDTNVPVLWLSYNNKRELLLNDMFLLTTPRNSSINDRLLSYLTNNPNKIVSRQELEAQGRLKDGEDKDFYVFLDDVKIKGDLRKAFFGKDLSKHTLNLKNPIYKKDLKEQQIEYIDLKKLFKK
jgi:hypothetical protein